MHARTVLTGIAAQLFAEIQAYASAAEVTHKKELGRFDLHQAKMGHGILRMTIGQYDLIPKDEFAGSKWDVICGDAILAELVGSYVRPIYPDVHVARAGGAPTSATEAPPGRSFF